MSKIVDIATVQRQTETALSDFNSGKVYNSSKLVLDDIGDQTDIIERTTELARNDYSPNKPYNSSSAN